MARAQVLGMLDRIEEARDAGREAMRRGRAADFADGIAHGGLLAGLAAERLGDTEDAVAAYDEAMVGAASEPELLARIRRQRAAARRQPPRG